MVKTNTTFRPPIVTVMGHIDHGKTTLLDKIRESSVAARESGGITQHINAYQAHGITFIDTPGHAAFCNMRSRGAKITDIVVLVIAATDGIMAQTKECIEHIKTSDLPVIVALNKIDLDTASPDKAKGQLVEIGLTPEEYGGQVAVMPVSAKTGQGIEELLARIKLQAEIMELKSEPTGDLEAVVIESRLDKNSGPIASLVVQKGTLKVGDQVYAQDIFGKIKSLTDSNGKSVSQAGPSTPVEILGFQSVPPVGALVTGQITTPVTFNNTKSETDDNQAKIKAVIKADVNGSLEAIQNSLSTDVNVISCGIGAVSDTDVFLAQAGKAVIYAFNVKVPPTVAILAENQKVKIFSSKIIYEILEDLEKKVLKMLEPTIDEDTLGEGQIIAEFKINGTRIAGIKITKGEVTKGDAIHLTREGKIIKDTKVEGIHQAKSVIEKIKVGSDCGMTFRPYVDFKINDGIIAYKKKEEA